MSDLTRLNPTPHAIAVYASQPLSPVATQHSLPSRTLPFTWAGLSPAGSHQLCLAHSLDHLIGAGEQRRGISTPTAAFITTGFMTGPYANLARSCGSSVAAISDSELHPVRPWHRYR